MRRINRFFRRATRMAAMMMTLKSGNRICTMRLACSMGGGLLFQELQLLDPPDQAFDVCARLEQFGELLQILCAEERRQKTGAENERLAAQICQGLVHLQKQDRRHMQPAPMDLLRKVFHQLIPLFVCKLCIPIENVHALPLCISVGVLSSLSACRDPGVSGISSGAQRATTCSTEARSPGWPLGAKRKVTPRKASSRDGFARGVRVTACFSRRQRRTSFQSTVPRSPGPRALASCVVIQ